MRQVYFAIREKYNLEFETHVLWNLRLLESLQYETNTIFNLGKNILKFEKIDFAILDKYSLKFGKNRNKLTKKDTFGEKLLTALPN